MYNYLEKEANSVPRKVHFSLSTHQEETIRVLGVLLRPIHSLYEAFRALHMANYEAVSVPQNSATKPHD